MKVHLQNDCRFELDRCDLISREVWTIMNLVSYRGHLMVIEVRRTRGVNQSVVRNYLDKIFIEKSPGRKIRDDGVRLRSGVVEKESDNV